MNPSTPRIVASAVHDERTDEVVVAGQVLDGRTGVEGVAVTVTVAGRTFEVTTGPHGSFGVRCESPPSVPAQRATVQLDAIRSTFDVR
jgi:hypothetical protein